MNKQKTLIFSLSAMLFLTASFLVYSWSEPEGTMPDGYQIPINTSATAQTKSGDFSATSFVDANDSNYYINPSGNSIVSGKIVMEDSTASADIPTTVATKGYVDTEIARVESTVNGSLPLVYNMHTREACEAAEGEVVDSDVSLPMCKFISSTCPENWTQYKNFSVTTPRSCTVDPRFPFDCDFGCNPCAYYPGGIVNTTGSHSSFSNIPLEIKTKTGYAGQQSASGVCPNCASGGGCASCTATASITEIGCY